MKKKMKMISTLLVLTIVFSITACGKKTEENTDSVSQSEQQTEAAWQEQESAQPEEEKQTAGQENAAGGEEEQTSTEEEQDENAPLGIYKTELSNSYFEMVNDNYYSLC